MRKCENFLLKARKCSMVPWVAILMPCSKSKQVQSTEKTRVGHWPQEKEGRETIWQDRQTDLLAEDVPLPYPLPWCPAPSALLFHETPLHPHSKPPLRKQPWVGLCSPQVWAKNGRRAFSTCQDKEREWWIQQKFPSCLLHRHAYHFTHAEGWGERIHVTPAP